MLGRMYLRGEGMKQDFGLARLWFERGAEFGEKESHNGLGIIWRDGLLAGGKKDLSKAGKYFALAANQDLAEAQVNLGKFQYRACYIPLIPLVPYPYLLLATVSQKKAT